MRKICRFFCIVMVILSMTNIPALAAEPEGKVIDLGDGFYVVETIMHTPMARASNTAGGSKSGNVYYGSTQIGIATLYGTFDISGSAARAEKANISGTGSNGGTYSNGTTRCSGNTVSGTAYFTYNGVQKSIRLSLTCTPDGSLS